MSQRTDIIASTGARECEPVVVSQPEYVNFNSAWSLLARKKATLALCMALGVLLAAVLIFTQDKVYESRASIEIQIPNEDYLNRRQLSPVSGLNAIMLEPYLQTQLRLLQSDTTLLRAAREVNLAGHPEYNRPPGWIARIKNGFRPVEKKSLTDLGLLEIIRDRLSLRLVGQTQVLDILYESTDPQLAAAMANTLAAQYQAASLSLTTGPTSRAATLLSSQLAELKSELDLAEARLRNFVEANALLPSNNQESVVELRLKQLQAALGAAQEARVAAQSKYQMVKNASPEALAQELESETLRAYRVNLMELRRQYAENSQVLTPNHYKVRQIQAEIDEVQKAFDQERAGILGRLQNDYESADFQEKALTIEYESQAAQVARLTGQSVRYGTLKHDVELSRQVYDLMLQKVQEADLATALNASNVRLIDPAVPGEDPVKPNKPLALALGMGSGLLAGMVLVFSRGRAPAPASRACESTFKAAPTPLAAQSLPLRTNPRELVAIPSPRLTGKPRNSGLNFGMSYSLEAATGWLMRASRRGSGGPVICVRGLTRESGDAAIPAALARQLAAAGRRTLLIDADDQAPSVHKMFGVSNAFGLFDLVLINWQEAETEGTNAIWTVDGGLCVIPVGQGTGRIPEIARIARIPALFENFRKFFDIVLIHMPPPATRGETECLASAADGTVLAAAAGPASLEQIGDVARRLQSAGVKVVHVLSLPVQSENGSEAAAS